MAHRLMAHSLPDDEAQHRQLGMDIHGSMWICLLWLPTLPTCQYQATNKATRRQVKWIR